VQQGACRTIVEPDIEELLADGAHALNAYGDLLASRTRFERAHREAERAGNTTAIAEAVLGLCGLWVHEHRTAAASMQLRERLRHALSLVDPKSPVALRLRIRLAAEADYHAGEHETILAALDEARQAGDPVARAEALSLAHHCLLGPEHGPLRRTLADELIGQSFRTMRRTDLLMGLLWQTVDLFLDADPLAGRRLGELRELLARQGHLAVGFVVSAIDVLLAIRSGRFDDAEALIGVCAARGAAAGDIDATGWSGGQLFAIRWYQGRVAELLPMFDELAQSPTLSVVDNSFFAALAVAAASAGDRRTAAGVLATLCGRDLADLPRSSTWLVTMTGIVEAAYLLDDPDTAARAYELLHPFAHLPVIASLGVACFGSVHHALGVASLTTGDLDRAVEHCREAVKANSAIGHWPAAVNSRVRYAQALTLRALPADAVIVRRELATAADEAAALNIPLPDHRSRPAACLRQGGTWEIDAVDLVAGPTPSDYRRRLSELRAEIDEQEAKDGRARADGARAERDWLIAEVVGGGRVPDADERAIAPTADADPVIGSHLDNVAHPDPI
jgi:tetratricopeptide (TPR) repeat protein